jgi:acetyltransferase-like isoleucine patch superfamily enzyme
MSADARHPGRNPVIATGTERPGAYHGGTLRERGLLYRRVESVTPSAVKVWTKRAVTWSIRYSNRTRHVQKGRFVELGRQFRFDRQSPHVARIGERSITEDFNVWNASYGDIVVGTHCWFGLHNIVMGPVQIGDRVSTGPHVSILGPRHPTFGGRVADPPTTVIGADVWISAGVIILSGAVIGNGAVIGAGSVVSGRVPPDATYVETRTSHILPRFS